MKGTSACLSPVGAVPTVANAVLYARARAVPVAHARAVEKLVPHRAYVHRLRAYAYDYRLSGFWLGAYIHKI
jgi:hypothetical protein